MNSKQKSILKLITTFLNPHGYIDIEIYGITDDNEICCENLDLGTISVIKNLTLKTFIKHLQEINKCNNDYGYKLDYIDIDSVSVTIYNAKQEIVSIAFMLEENKTDILSSKPFLIN